jgi:NADPH-dependent 2,4-dienoyl-CoA reductase/sulfur reductase-like enzyme
VSRALSTTQEDSHGGALRLRDPALTPVERIEFSFDGRRLTGYAGESIAAALTAAGILDLGRRRDSSSRGVFCAMGVCQECLVKVDGAASKRACMVPVASGMAVESQVYAVPPSRAAFVHAAAPQRHRPEVLVVGAGPAGLAAARAAALSGAKALIVDERSDAGGQYFKQVAKSHAIIDYRRLDSQARTGKELIVDVERLGVTIWRDAAVWGAFGTDEITMLAQGRQHVFTPERLVLATGAYERGVPVPGWTLPGYMTTGAAQTLMRAYRVSPGRRVLVAGNGPLNFQLGAELVRAGIKVAAVVESAADHGLRKTASVWRAAKAAPGLVRDGIRYVALLMSAGVPIIYGSAVVSARGDRRVEECSIARIDAAGRAVPGTERSFPVDCVCTGYGFLASNEIARTVGCRHKVDSRTGAWVTLVDENGLTSIPGVYAIGDAAVFRGAHAARYQGFITGCAVARSLGLTLSAAVEDELAQARHQLSKHLAFQGELWRLFASPPLTVQYATSDTVLCRCESVTRQAVESAVRDGAVSLGEIKRRTRLGMGRCQGRYCEPLAVAVTQQEATPARDELSRFAPRTPFKPIRVKDLI